MLKYNFDIVFKAKGIARPFTFLKQAGFSDNFATKIKNNRVNKISLDLLERLCVKIACTPNDFLEWSPDNKNNLEQTHPLYQLKRRNDKISDLSKSLNSLTLDKLEKIERLINE